MKSNPTDKPINRERVKERKKHLKMSSMNLCNYAGVTDAHFSNIMTGKRFPQKHTLELLAYACNCSTDYLTNESVEIGETQLVPVEYLENNKYLVRVYPVVLRNLVSKTNLTPSSIDIKVGLPCGTIKKAMSMVVVRQYIPIEAAKRLEKCLNADMSEFTMPNNKTRKSEIDPEENKMAVKESTPDNRNLKERAIDEMIETSDKRLAELTEVDKIRRQTDNQRRAMQQMTNLSYIRNSYNGSDALTANSMILVKDLVGISKIISTNPDLFDMFVSVTKMDAEQIEMVINILKAVVKE